MYLSNPLINTDEESQHLEEEKSTWGGGNYVWNHWYDTDKVKVEVRCLFLPRSSESYLWDRGPSIHLRHMGPLAPWRHVHLLPPEPHTTLASGTKPLCHCPLWPGPLLVMASL